MLYPQALCTTEPILFELCECKDASVERIKSGEVQVTFRRWLPVELRSRWEEIWCDASPFILVNEPDKIIWTLEKNQKFSVKSTYNALTSRDTFNLNL